MKECFGTIMEELLLYNLQAILIFTVYGVTISDANTQDQHFIPVDNLSEDSDIISGFLKNDSELSESPVEKAKEPTIDLMTLLKTPPVDESTVIFNPTFKKIKAEDLIDVEKLFESYYTNETLIDNNIKKKVSSTTIQLNEENIKKEPQEKSYNSDTWKIQLEKLLRRVYTEKSDQLERTIIYHRIGKLIANPPTKYKLQQYKVKEELSKSLGVQIGEKQFVTA